MRSPRLRLRLALPRYSVARDAQRGLLTLAAFPGSARLASGRARPAEYTPRRGLPRASSGSQLAPVPRAKLTHHRESEGASTAPSEASFVPGVYTMEFSGRIRGGRDRGKGS